MRSQWKRPAIIGCAGIVVLIGAAVWWMQGSERSVAALANDLGDRDAKTRYQAAKDLEDRAEEASAAVPELAEALSDSETKIRYRAAKALSKIGRNAAPAVPELTIALGDEDEKVRYYAARSALENL